MASEEVLVTEYKRVLERECKVNNELNSPMDEDEQAAGAGEAATKLAGEAAAEHVADAGVAAKLPRRCSREDVPPKMFSNGVPDDVPATGLRQGCDAEQGCDRVATAPERTTILSNALGRGGAWA